VQAKSPKQLDAVRQLLLEYQTLLPTLTMADGLCP
jgi:hypothetical protein